MLSREQDRAVRAEAIQLLRDIDITAYPIDPAAIAEVKQLSVAYVDLQDDDIFGALWRENNQYGIMISTRCSTDGLRRFTVAHELGHYMLPGHAEKMFRRDKEMILSTGGNYRRKDLMEIEADTFASELLLPEQLARHVVRANGASVDGIIALSESFLVSVSAAAIRTAELTGEPMAVILSRDGKCEWCTRSPSLAVHKWSLRSLKNDRVPQGSATSRVVSNTAHIAQGKRDHDTMSLSRWFDDAPADLEIVEDAVGLGSYGRVLTTLTFKDHNLPDPDELYVREERAQRERWERDDEQFGAQARQGDWRKPLRSFQWEEEE